MARPSRLAGPGRLCATGICRRQYPFRLNDVSRRHRNQLTSRSTNRPISSITAAARVAGDCECSCRHHHLQQPRQLRLGRYRSLALVRDPNPQCRDPGSTCRALHSDDPAGGDDRLQRLVSTAAAALGCLHRIPGHDGSAVERGQMPRSRSRWTGLAMDWTMPIAGPSKVLVIGQNNTAGTPVEVASIIGVYLSGGSSGSAKTVFFIGVPFSNAVLDTTYAQQINNAPVIKMSAGQAIAFEGTNSNRLLFDSTTNTLRWNQGTLSYAVGKGISVGWVNVYSSSTTLPNYISGNMIILSGNAAYSITLPPASTVAAGTGFTFSVTGTGPVSILPSGTDGIESRPDCPPFE